LARERLEQSGFFAGGAEEKFPSRPQRPKSEARGRPMSPAKGRSSDFAAPSHVVTSIREKSGRDQFPHRPLRVRRNFAIPQLSQSVARVAKSGTE
jgi:hypothetical protein